MKPMTRAMRLQEARDALEASRQEFYQKAEVPTKRVTLDLLLIDLIDAILGHDDRDAPSLLERSYLVRENPAEGSTAAQVQYVVQELKKLIKKGEQNMEEITNAYDEGPEVNIETPRGDKNPSIGPSEPSDLTIELRDEIKRVFNSKEEESADSFAEGDKNDSDS